MDRFLFDTDLIIDYLRSNETFEFERETFWDAVFSASALLEFIRDMYTWLKNSF